MPPLRPAGYLSFTLHAHLPWVVHHGTWPHGLEWLLEAAAETYLPLLRMLGTLERDGIALHCNLNLSPILLEQLAHPLFKSELPKYLERKIAAAREDEAYFLSMNEAHFAETARYWQSFFQQALRDFQDLQGDLIAAFRGFHERGRIEIITCAATHGYTPLLGTDESLRAQVRVGMDAHRRHLDLEPRGIWSPECGYRPAGPWSFPIPPLDTEAAAPVNRIGLEQVLDESGLSFFIADTHLIEDGAAVYAPYTRNVSAGRVHVAAGTDHRRLYQPYRVSSAAHPTAVAVFPRDPRTGAQVWSGENGYPGDASYLDFHKKRWPGGHRYWKVTGAGVDIGDKQPYSPQEARDRVRDHASHFIHLVWQALESSLNEEHPPILTSPFDAELFGHWWFEGVAWLEAVARTLHDYPIGIALTSGSAYLDAHPPQHTIRMEEGSWGAGGGNEVWLNAETTWTWQRIYAAELYIRDTVSRGEWRSHETAARILRQMCRELLLLESSDWQFLITTGAARDYAESRFNTHHDQFHELRELFEEALRGADPNLARLEAIEARDSIFPELDPEYWSLGARAAHSRSSTNSGPAQQGVADAGSDATISELPKFQ